ncbi:MAG: hypothetical protein HFI90_12175 [Clostridia bacterium]|nr:hypothetical protein [Clostridia bacterium]
MYEEEILNSFYEIGKEEQRFSTRHGMVEFITTKKYINKYLKKTIEFWK